MAKSKDLPANITATGWCTTNDINIYKGPIAREKQLKGWTRAKKIALIESRNPRWEDLAEKWGAEMLFANQSIEEASKKK